MGRMFWNYMSSIMNSRLLRMCIVSLACFRVVVFYGRKFCIDIFNHFLTIATYPDEDRGNNAVNGGG